MIVQTSFPHPAEDIRKMAFITYFASAVDYYVKMVELIYFSTNHIRNVEIGN